MVLFDQITQVVLVVVEPGRTNGEAFCVRLNKGCGGKMVAAAKADTSTLLRHIMLSSKGSAEHLRRRKKSEAVLTTILNANSDL